MSSVASQQRTRRRCTHSRHKHVQPVDSSALDVRACSTLSLTSLSVALLATCLMLYAQWRCNTAADRHSHTARTDTLTHTEHSALHTGHQQTPSSASADGLHSTVWYYSWPPAAVCGPSVTQIAYGITAALAILAVLGRHRARAHSGNNTDGVANVGRVRSTVSVPRGSATKCAAQWSIGAAAKAESYRTIYSDTGGTTVKLEQRASTTAAHEPNVSQWHNRHNGNADGTVPQPAVRTVRCSQHVAELVQSDGAFTRIQLHGDNRYRNNDKQSSVDNASSILIRRAAETDSTAANVCALCQRCCDLAHAHVATAKRQLVDIKQRQTHGHAGDWDTFCKVNELERGIEHNMRLLSTKHTGGVSVSVHCCVKCGQSTVPVHSDTASRLFNQYSNKETVGIEC